MTILAISDLEARPVTESDLGEITSWFSDDIEFFYWTGNDLRYEDRETDLNHILRCNTEIIAPVMFVEKSNKQVVGYAEVHLMNKHSKWCRLSRIAVNPDARKKGFGTIIINFLGELAKKMFDHNRLDLLVYPSNRPAIALYEKCAFTIEGTMGQIGSYNGELFDAHIMCKETG